jgi:hypothetical protein
LASAPHSWLRSDSVAVPENARRILRAALPPPVFDALEPGSLRPAPENTVGPDLRALGCDLVFTARLEGVETEVLVFLEHESRPERLLPFHLLAYGVGLVQRWLRENVHR